MHPGSLNPGLRFHPDCTSPVVSSTVQVGFDECVVAAIAIMDPLKPEAAQVVAALQRQGVTCRMLTGDNVRTAHAIAAQLNLQYDHVHAGPGWRGGL